jgi:hypothetical protein
MARSTFAGTLVGNNRTLDGLPRLEKILAAMPDTLKANVKESLRKSADAFVERLHQVLPISEMDTHPGALRDSAHREDGPSSVGSTVIVDAKDHNGESYAKHVEFGHKTKTGKHVAAKPAFYPALRLMKKQIVADVRQAVFDSVQQAKAKAST